METIFAEATPPGRGGVSIVRLSGPQAPAMAEALAGGLPPDRVAAVRRLREGGDVIDDALVLTFPEGSSFTGEPVVEFHLHGAPVVVRRLSAALGRLGARLAGPGEFTRRAFLNGRLDLTRVQGLSDLLVAETEAQRVLAMRNASGELGRLAAGWREALVRASALVMASLDFPDEDVPDVVPPEVAQIVTRLVAALDDALAGAQSAERVRAGFTVAVIGPPNAGKSSFINRLAGRDVAIVTDRPGTTRDLLEVHLDLGGLAVTVVDTAGLRETSDEIEVLGIARAEAAAQAAALRLHLSESGDPVEALWQPGDIAVRTKADLGGPGVSAMTGAGIAELVAEIEARLPERVAGAGLVSHAVQIAQIRAAREALAQVHGAPAEIAAEHLAEAARSLASLVGLVDIEDYLDVVFSAFCIGK